MEAGCRRYLCQAPYLSRNWHSAHKGRTPAQARQDAGHEVIRRILSACALIALTTTTLVACGSDAKTDYSAFCKLAVEMQNASSGGSHGQDPAAITEPKKMEEAWTTITNIAIKMRDGAPTETKVDVATMVNSIVAMNTVFKANKYDLLAMSKKPKVREELAKISSDAKVASASQRFNAFMKKNCKATS